MSYDRRIDCASFDRPTRKRRGRLLAAYSRRWLQLRGNAVSSTTFPRRKYVRSREHL